LNRRDLARIAAAKRLARAKEREANARLDGLHKAANRIVRSADVIALEALDVRGMTRSAKGTLAAPGRNVAAKSGLNRALLERGLGNWLRVDPKSRRRRRFRCVACGWTCHADVAAALEIRRRAELQRKSMLPRARTPLTSQDAA
jgi:putative transposase